MSLPHSPTQTQKALELLNKQNSRLDLSSANFSPSMFSPPDHRTQRSSLRHQPINIRNLATSIASSSQPNATGAESPDLFSMENSRESRPPLLGRF